MSTNSTDTEYRANLSTELVAGLGLLTIVSLFLLNSGRDVLDWVFPISLASVGAVIGIYLVVRGLLGFGTKMSAVPAVMRGKGIQVGMFILMAVLYAGLARLVGFWIMSFTMVFAASVYLAEERSRKTVLISAASALGLCVFAYWLFTYVFYVPFPPALWLPW